MSEGPKLYSKKPKKSQLKQRQGSPSLSSSSSSSMATPPPSTAPPPPPPPPPQPPTESFARRYKFIWPLLLAVNFTIGAYLFMRTKKKDIPTEEDLAVIIPPAPVSSTAAAATAPISEKSVSSPPLTVKTREPIPENQQRELFKWLLEEKRKVNPKDRDEKKRVDEEKAILKHFIRAKSIPSL